MRCAFIDFVIVRAERAGGSGWCLFTATLEYTNTEYIQNDEASIVNGEDVAPMGPPKQVRLKKVDSMTCPWAFQFIKLIRQSHYR